jgi:prepilin-type N-terminal cleavage/methylation domain-containing protein
MLRNNRKIIESKRGFTLVELMIVLIILGIMFSVSVYAIRSFLAGNRNIDEIVEDENVIEM